MVKLKNYKILLVISAVFILLLCYMVMIFFIIFYIPWKNWNGTFVKYDEIILSANEKYIGIIDRDNKKVMIENHSGKEVSHVDTREGYPNQIALGKYSYFLLYRWEDENGYGKIVQYDYQSHKIKEYAVSDVATIACRDGYLFMGDWKHEDEDVYYYFTPYYNSFYANSYCEEAKFGCAPQALQLNQEGRCTIGNVEMYYHKEGYFSTEPEIEDYPGTSRGDFTPGDENYNYQAETNQETKNRSLLLDAVGKVEGIQEPDYCVSEYQVNDTVFGVCNIFEQWIPSRPVEPKDVIQSYYYKINMVKNEIKILGKTDSAIAIIASDSVLVYQKGRSIIQKNVISGDEKVIYKIKNPHDMKICVRGDFLLIVEQKKRGFANSSSTEETTSFPVSWK